MDEKKDLRESEEEKYGEGIVGGEDGKANKGLPTIVEVILGLIIWAVFIVIVVGAFKNDCIQCKACGDENNRLFIYSRGTNAQGEEFLSCVGPAGIIGCGLNSKCWPTECLYFKSAHASNEQITGCVKYYNEGGCISTSDVKSEGLYSDDVTCLGISCFGENYIEDLGNNPYAFSRKSCFGCGCGNKVYEDVREYNAAAPRQFTRGCWSNNIQEDAQKGGE